MGEGKMNDVGGGMGDVGKVVEEGVLKGEYGEEGVEWMVKGLWIMVLRG